MQIMKTKNVTSEEVECLVRNSWMAAVEKAHITIVSPTGNSVTVYKKHLTDSLMTKYEQELVWSCSKFYKEIKLTKEQMSILLKLSKIPFFQNKFKTQNYENITKNITN